MLKRKRNLITILCLLFCSAIILSSQFFAQKTFARSDYEFEYVTIKSVQLSRDIETILYESDEEQLNITTTPSYAIKTAKNISFEITQGNHLASISSSGFFVVNEKIAIGGEVIVKATIDNIISNLLTITIEKSPEIDFIAPTFISISNKQPTTRVDENSVFKVTDLISTIIEPSTCSITEPTSYTLASGFDYVDFDGSKIYVKKNLPAGELSFSLKANAFEVSSEPISFNIYKPVKSLTFTANNFSPMSKKDIGDSVDLIAVVNPEATVQTPVIRVIEGADLINGNYINGDEIPSNFNIKKNLAGIIGSNKSIKIQAEIEQNGIIEKIEPLCILQDELRVEKKIEVYIPVEEFQLTSRNIVETTNYIDRGETEEIFFGNITQNADYLSWEVTQVKINNIVDATNQVEICEQSMTVKVPKTMSAGTKITVAFRSCDRLGNDFESEFFVAPMTDNEKNLFTYTYSKDSNNYSINQTNPQLWAGKSTTIELLINGLPISEFGITDYTIKIQSGSATALNHTLTANSSANGKTSIQFIAEVIDGSFTYSLPIGSIEVFRPMSGDIGFLNSNIVERQTQLSIRGITANDVSKMNQYNDLTRQIDALWAESCSLPWYEIGRKLDLAIQIESLKWQRSFLNTPIQVLSDLDSILWDSNATYNLSDLKFDSVIDDNHISGGTSITNNGILSINSISVSPILTIRYSCMQNYNEHTIVYQGEHRQELIKSLTLDNGSNEDMTIAVNGFDGVIKPKFTNCAFVGYFQNSDGTGKQYFDYNKKFSDIFTRRTSEPFTSNMSSRIYAKWIQNTQTLTLLQEKENDETYCVQETLVTSDYNGWQAVTLNFEKLEDMGYTTVTLTWDISLTNEQWETWFIWLIDSGTAEIAIALEYSTSDDGTPDGSIYYDNDTGWGVGWETHTLTFELPINGIAQNWLFRAKFWDSSKDEKYYIDWSNLKISVS